MDKSQLEQKITAALDANPYCAFATVEGNKPKVRYMALYHEGLQLHLATDRKTHKVEELKSNPQVFILAGYEAGGSKELLEIQGTAELTKNDRLRKDLWNDDLKQWFNGPEDPDLIILDIEPYRIEYTPQGGERLIWEK